jgi:hypothetical protein
MNHLLDDDIVSALGAILDTAPAPPTVRPPMPDAASVADTFVMARAEPGRRRPGRSALLVAASLVMLVGGLAMLHRRSPIIVAGQQSTSSAPTVDSSIEPSPVTTSATTTTTVNLSNHTGWYLPTFIPAGYEITSIDAAYSTSTFPVPQRWLRTDASGKVSASLTVATYPPSPPDPLKPETYNATVRGHQAFAGHTGEGFVVAWEEAGRVVSIRGVSMSSNETLAIAEAVTIESSTGTVVLGVNSNFVSVEAAPSVPNAVTLNIGLLRSDGATGGFASFSTSPTNGETLQTVKQRLDITSGRTVPIERIGAFDRLVDRHPADALGPFTDITWIQDGLMMEAVGRASADEVVRMAESVQVVDSARLVDEGRRITERLKSLATFEQVTLADGVVVSVKARSGNPVGLCVESPVAVCRWHVSEASLVGERQVGIFDTFDVAGRLLLLGWHQGSDTPTLQPVTEPDGSIRYSPVALSEVKQMNLGHFIEAVVPAGVPVPLVAYGPSSSYGVGTRSDTTLLHF